MKHKSIVHFPLVLLLAAATSQTATAAPLVSIGDNTDIFFNGSSSLQWSSNVFRNEKNETDDLMWSLTPGFELNVGRGASNLDFNVITQYEIRRYADLDELDTELFSTQINAAYRTSRLDLSGSAYFREQKTTTGDNNVVTNDLIESDVMGGRIHSEYRFSPKFSFGTGFSYSKTDYKSPFDDFLADRERFSVPLDLFYELTPKVDLSIGYVYSETDVDALNGRPSYTTDDHFFNVGARGNLLPKLTGFFKVGYRTRDSDRVNRSSESTLGLDSSLTWAATPKLTNTLTLSRDFGVGGEGFSSEDTSINVSSSYSINSYYAASAFAGYTLRDYQNNREDNQYRLGLRLNYTPNQHWRFGAGYTYSENDSDDPNRVDRSIRSYEDHTFDITASLRY
ncbi:MAG: outer membrane beta-barrel protein [Opitutales bacterium]